MSALNYTVDTTLTLTDILDILEERNASSYTEADIYICPPTIEDPTANTDEDSGDDECDNPDRLSRRLLHTEAEIHFSGQPLDEEDIVQDTSDGEPSREPSEDFEPKNGLSEIEEENITQPENLHFCGMGDVVDQSQPQDNCSMSLPENVASSSKNESVSGIESVTNHNKKQPRKRQENKRNIRPSQKNLQLNAAEKKKTRKRKADNKAKPSGTDNPNKKAKKSANKKEKPKTPERIWKKGDIDNPEITPNRMFPPITTLGKDSHPLDFFQCFITDDFVEEIVKYSVTYAVQKNNPSFELDLPDFYTFLGILYLTGYVPLPRKRMYWENSEDVKNTLVSKSMRRNRFDEILRYLHLCDNENVEEGDRMAKIRPVLDKLNSTFLQYAPAENKVSVDESMIPYFGRHSCKQFIRGKPIRFGFKAWVLATRNGYCLQADVYQGKHGKQNNKGLGLGESVVLGFCEVLSNKFPSVPFSFHTDNFFTSAKLITKLGDKGMKGTGTVRPNRLDGCPMPDKKTMMERDRGSYESFVDNNNIVAVIWKDNSAVRIVSNEHGVQPLGEAKRYSIIEKGKVSIPQPNLIGHYNRNMGGVDLMDNNISNYRIAIRGKRWYIPIVFWLFDVAMSNAWFFSRAHGLNLDSLGFRRSIVQALLQKYGRLPKSPGPSRVMGKASAPLRLDHGGHLIVTGQSRRRCVVCKNKTVKACKRCEVPLHDTCFAQFHSQ